MRQWKQSTAMKVFDNRRQETDRIGVCQIPSISQPTAQMIVSTSPAEKKMLTQLQFRQRSCACSFTQANIRANSRKCYQNMKTPNFNSTHFTHKTVMGSRAFNQPSNVVNHESTSCSSVVTSCNSPESLLTSCIPDLQFHFLSSNFNDTTLYTVTHTTNIAMNS